MRLFESHKRIMRSVVNNGLIKRRGENYYRDSNGHMFRAARELLPTVNNDLFEQINMGTHTYFKPTARFFQFLDGEIDTAVEEKRRDDEPWYAMRLDMEALRETFTQMHDLERRYTLQNTIFYNHNYNFGVAYGSPATDS